MNKKQKKLLVWAILAEVKGAAEAEKYEGRYYPKMMPKEVLEDLIITLYNTLKEHDKLLNQALNAVNTGQTELTKTMQLVKDAVSVAKSYEKYANIALQERLSRLKPMGES